MWTNREIRETKNMKDKGPFHSLFVTFTTISEPYRVALVPGGHFAPAYGVYVDGIYYLRCI